MSTDNKTLHHISSQMRVRQCLTDLRMIMSVSFYSKALILIGSGVPKLKYLYAGRCCNYM